MTQGEIEAAVAVAGNAARYDGQAVIVTGGTRGIGRSIALAFLAAGADVLVCGRSRPDLLPAVAGREASFVAADIRDAAEAKGVVTAAADRFGRLDVLVNNAGGGPVADAATASPRFFERVVALNLHAAFYVGQPANAVMRTQPGGGAIVNIGSVSGRRPAPGSAAYAAAKAGLVALTSSLALEWAPKVRVNHVTVGLANTAVDAGGFYGEATGAIDAVVPMGRAALPADVAAACLYLASPLAGYVTGADLEVHGGGELPGFYVATNKNT
ncbi:SDR family oxidoreductase [Pseudofrankia inefficax]|uniref:Short-chain dehydrogenase/reductase SDR n=1 Tax=Pseudofrankia inefficax (strain DSM 45817 / CECT 9037 / DDB 130130 / EuI1c) TaxID=298654 RepID=E3J2F3_PSEI1|nr:SDR family oxidoreductase [Pseudofrankia inefficax]ADP79325.1 short-chain dehydrogenase/reductase SDR [Pseudofrankia inefficax]